MISSTKLFLVVVVILISLLLFLVISANLSINILQITLFILAVVLIFIGGIIFFDRIYSTKRKIDQTTIIMRPHKLLGKLILPNGRDFVIKEYEKTLGREDFLGFTGADNLLFIGKKHFKLFKLDDGFYIEDLNTKNGTKINGGDIRGLGKIKLKNGDEITIARIKIRYSEEIY
jgi:FHA domain